MILHNLQIVGEPGIKHIHIKNGKINAIADDVKDFKDIRGEQHIEFDNAVAFPGFINSHDHLDFNLFPQLGNKIYNNYTEWGKDIHEKNKDLISEVLKVPEELRVQWGIYKNLLNGVTTVVNHGKRLPIRDDLITVLQFNSLHSPKFEKRWKWKLNDPFEKGPIVMHIGEGINANAEKEINDVIRWNIFKKKIVAVHGVAMNEKQANSFYGLVWCPASNYFLLDKTAEVGKLKDKTKVVFGTDSTLTASWNMWEHFRMAKRSGINERELLGMLTIEPARLWRLNSGELEEGLDADIVVATLNDKNNSQIFFNLDPSNILLVLKNGKVRLFDNLVRDQLVNGGLRTEEDSIFTISGRDKNIIGNLPGLIKEIEKYYKGLSFPIEI